jgi:hypothetical protein
MTIKTFIIAHLPPGLEKAFVQHVRDFDVAHPGCHFEIGVEAPTLSLVEAVDMLRVDPALTFTEVFKRAKNDEARDETVG